MTPSSSDKLPVSPELEALADSVGQFMKYWGFKAIHGKVWTYIYFSSTPITATELVAQIDVTKGLMSMVLSDLVEYGTIEKVDLGNAKSPGYQTQTELSEAIFKILRTRELKMLEEINQRLEDYSQLVRGDRAQVHKAKQLTRMAEFALDALDRLLKTKVVSTSKLKHLLRLAR